MSVKVSDTVPSQHVQIEIHRNGADFDHAGVMRYRPCVYSMKLTADEARDLYEALGDYFWKEIAEKATENVRLTVPQRSEREQALEAKLIATEYHLEDMRMLLGTMVPRGTLKERMDEVLKEAKETVQAGDARTSRPMGGRIRE